jgi:acetolactate synthase I/II/III large subunit
VTAVESRTATGGAEVVAVLYALGVRTIFGVPGGQTLAITDAMLDYPDMRFVTARHEGAAACMADAYGRIAGEPGVCLATTGPGATNMLTGIGGAFRDSSPVVAITCNNRLGDLDRDDAQAADHVAIFSPLVKWAKLVSTPASIRQALEEAYQRARLGCPGPVLVDFARDVLESRLPGELAAPPEPTAARRPLERPLPSTDLLHAAANRLRTARKPTLWLGNGAKVSGAGSAALDLAEALDMPVLTTFNGIGAVPTNHPLVFGPLSRMGTELSTRILADTELLLAVGNSLNGVSTGRWSLQLPEIVQIDIDPTVIGRYYASQTVGLWGDAQATLVALTDLVSDERRPDRARAARSARLGQLQQAKSEWWDAVAVVDQSYDGDSVSPHALMRTVREVTPDEAILVVDAGNPGVWSYLWEVRAANTYIKPVGFGNMGFALPAAVGVHAARPELPIVVFVGDGSLGMSLAELETVARERVPATIVVLNDSSYGNIRQEQIVHYGADRTIGVDFGDVDFATVAQGCGVPGERATSLDELSAALRRASAARGPFLIDVVIDGNVNAWTFPPFQPFSAAD